MKKIVSLLLVMALSFTFSAWCMAFTTSNVPDTKVVYIGRVETDEGDAGDATIPEDANFSRSESLRFSYTAQSILDFVSTRTSPVLKTVTKWDNNYNFRVAGSAYYTPELSNAPSVSTTSAYYRCGLCWYNNSTGIFESNPFLYDEPLITDNANVLINRNQLNSDKIYYGFAKNLYNGTSGYVYRMTGDFYVYNVT